MKTTELPESKNLIDSSEVPEVINAIKLSSFQKDKFAKGEFVFLEAMQLQDGRIVDGKIKLTIDQDNKTKVELYEKKAILEIPDQILSYRLSKKEKEDLLAEKTVGIKIPSGQQLFFQVDKDLNRVMVLTDRDLSIISEIGNYKLSQNDKSLWINGEKLPTRIFFDSKTGAHFAASIRKTDNGKGVEYHDYKSLNDIPKDQLASMISKYNSAPDVLTISGSVTEGIKPDTFDSKVELQTTETRTVFKEKLEPSVIKINDHVILTLDQKPYKVLDITENGNKMLLEDKLNKKIGISAEHVRPMTKKEISLFVSNKKDKNQSASLQI